MNGARVPRDEPSERQPAARSAQDSPPPAPPHELEPDTAEALVFEVAGEQWLARVAGKGAGGTGAYGLGMLDAIHFCRADAPETPLREALLERGRFAALFEDELRSLLAGASPIVNLESRPEPRQGGRR